MPALLVSTQELADRLGDASIVICDCRHDLMDLEKGRRGYAEGHIPGAHFIHLDEDLSGTKTGKNGRHPLPQIDAFAKKMGSIGIDHSKRVIAYDDAGGPYAARLWWLLRWAGHDNVAVLDGGINKWQAEGRAVDRTSPITRPATFAAKLKDGMTVDANFILANIKQPSAIVVDARAPERYRGEMEPVDPVAGHIPGALNRLFKNNLNADGTFKPVATLKQEFAELLKGKSPGEVVNQCGSGVTACHNLFAMEIAGLSGSKLYPGSWSEWCADPARPVAKGHS
jgi:thiosulfate/3-mercaptopyruvate sulfurtransferase